MTPPPGISPTVHAFETFESSPEYAAIYAAVKTGTWAAVEAAFAHMPADQVGFALVSLGNVDGVERLLEQAVADDPRSALAKTALAARYIVIGWNARTGARAAHVSRQQFTTFFEWLNKAEEVLAAVFVEHPQYAPAWSTGLLTARGLKLGKEEAWHRYRQVDALSPHDYPAQSQMHQYILPKWYGSDEEASTFAHDVANRAPDGSNSISLVAMQHLERWVELDAKAGKAYLSQRAVRDELRAAARRSVLHPAHQLDPAGVQAHTTFAMAFWVGGHKADAANHLRILGSRAAEFPWAYAGFTPANVDWIRRKVVGRSAR